MKQNDVTLETQLPIRLDIAMYKKVFIRKQIR